MVSLFLLLTVVGEDIKKGELIRRRFSRLNFFSLSKNSSKGYHGVANSILNKGDVFSEGLA
jgi:hypothetical protein